MIVKNPCGASAWLRLTGRAGLLVAGFLAACGGGDDGGPPSPSDCVSASPTTLAAGEMALIDPATPDDAFQTLSEMLAIGQGTAVFRSDAPLVLQALVVLLAPGAWNGRPVHSRTL